MFTLKLDEVKSRFFDRTAVTSRLSKAKRRQFSKAGGLTRKIARNSMRPVSKRILKQISKKRKIAFLLVTRANQTPSTLRARAKIAEEIRALEKQAASKPGQPPKTRKGTIKKQLFYAFDPGRESVVIGPILFAPKNNAPETLEYGGQTTIGPQKVYIAARPYMGPARDKVMPQVAGFFRDSL